MANQQKPDLCPICSNPSWVTGKKGAICTKCGFVKSGEAPVGGGPKSKSE